MNQNLLTFPLSDNEKLIILSKNENDLIDCCYQAPIVLNINNQNIIIGNSSIANYVERLQGRLILALSNKLELDLSIQQSLGYYWNQCLNEESPNISFVQGKEGKHWVGTKYFLWGTAGGAQNKFAVWFYNDHLENIIFEITPLFSGTLVDWDDSVEIQAYQEWMAKSYKPFYTRIIPKEIAQQWLDKANLILETIKNNVKMLEE